MPVDIYGSDGNGIEDDIDMNGFRIINANLDMLSHYIQNIHDPVNAQDAATKNYVDTTSSGWNLQGNTLVTDGKIGSLNDKNVAIVRNNEWILRFMPNYNEINGNLYFRQIGDEDLVEPEPEVGVTNTYMGCSTLVLNNSFTVLLGDSNNTISWRKSVAPIFINTRYGCSVRRNNVNIISFGNAGDDRVLLYKDLFMNTNWIGGVKDPINAQDAATKNYVDTRNNLYVLKAGDTVTGNLIFDFTGKTDLGILCNTAIPVNGASYFGVNLSNKLMFVKGADSNISVDLCCEKTFTVSITPIGVLYSFTNVETKFDKPLNMNTNPIKNVLNPVNAQDAATKNYVDRKRCLSGYIPHLDANLAKNGFYVIASSEYSTGFRAYQCCNESTYEWATRSQTSNYWIKIQCVEPICVWRFKVRGRISGVERMYNWRFEGSSDNVNWNILYTAVNDYVGINVKTYDLLNNTALYQWYRIYVVNAEPDNPGLSYFQLYTYLV